MPTGSRDRLQSYNGSGEITYDVYGNAEKWFKHGAVSRVGLELSRDLHGRLTKITDTETGETYTYGYDGSGLRESKTASGVTHAYRYIGDKLAEEVRSDGKKLLYYYDDAGLRTIVYASGGEEKKYRVRRNLQGDVEKLVDGNGRVVVEYVYDAWGKHTVQDGSDEGIGSLNSIRYRGYCYDEETELYYLKSRYYDPEVGRFLSADSIEYLDPESLNGLNLYAYCNNNPVNYVDPTGQFWDTILDIGFLIWSVVDLVRGGWKDWKNWAALGVDVLFAVIPFIPSGGGQIISVGNKMDNALDVADAINHIDNIQDIAKVTLIGRSMDRVKDTAALIGKADNLYIPWRGYDVAATGFKKLVHNTISMLHDGYWMFGKLRKGYTVIDIGMKSTHRYLGLYYGIEKVVSALWKSRNVWKFPIHLF